MTYVYTVSDIYWTYLSVTRFGLTPLTNWADCFTSCRVVISSVPSRNSNSTLVLDLALVLVGQGLLHLERCNRPCELLDTFSNYAASLPNLGRPRRVLQGWTQCPYSSLARQTLPNSFLRFPLYNRHDGIRIGTFGNAFIFFSIWRWTGSFCPCWWFALGVQARA